MERCHGKTKSGDRCKRSVPAGLRFCASHGGQTQETAGRSDSSGERSLQRDPVNTLIGLAMLSAVVWAALTFRRLFRF
jgi:hypothetical protein